MLAALRCAVHHHLICHHHVQSRFISALSLSLYIYIYIYIYIHTYIHTHVSLSAEDDTNPSFTWPSLWAIMKRIFGQPWAK